MSTHKYGLQFSDRLGDVWDIEIYEVGVVNTPVQIKGSDVPLRITARSSQDIFEPIVVQEATVEVISENDLQFKAFFTAQRGEWRLVVKKNSAVYWEGQNITESYSEPYIITPYRSQLKFSDLGDLDFLFYKDGSGNYFTGYRTLAQIILDCTNKLAHNLSLVEMINTLPLQYFFLLPANPATLTLVSIDARAFREYKNNNEDAMVCMKVLKRIIYALGCRMFQRNGKYYILSIDEATNASGDITGTFEINTSAAVSVAKHTVNILKSIDNTALTGITPANMDQDLSMSDRYNRVIHTYVTQETIRKNSELIFNNEFDKGIYTHNNTSNFPKYWKVSSDISAKQACEVVSPNTLEFDATSFVLGFPPGPVQTPHPGTNEAQGKYIPQNSTKYHLKVLGSDPSDPDSPSAAALRQINCSTSDNLRVAFKGRIQKAINYSQMNTLSLPFVNASNVRIWMGLEIQATFTASGNVYTCRVDPTHPPSGNYSWNGGWVLRTVTTPSWSSNGSGLVTHDDSFEFELDTAKFPENGLADFSIKLFIPRGDFAFQGSWGYMARSYLNKVSCRYVTDGDFSDDIVTDVTLFTVTNAKENAYDYTVHHGDGPANYDVSSFRLTNVLPINGITSLWRKLDDATQKSARDIFNLTQANKILTNYQRIIRGTYLGAIDLLNALTIDDGVSVRRYLIIGDDYDVKASLHSLEIHEITASAKVVVSTLTAGPKKKKKKSVNSNTKPALKSSVFASSTKQVFLNSPNKISNQNDNQFYPE